MTIRERIADYITGGALTRARNRADAVDGLCQNALGIARLSETQCRALAAQCYELQHRLNLIAAEERPTSNATVRRMARIARGEV